MALVRFMFDLANATGVGVFSARLGKTSLFQMFVSYSPNPRSHEARRISVLRDRFLASWQQGQCSAPPA